MKKLFCVFCSICLFSGLLAGCGNTTTITTQSPQVSVTVQDTETISPSTSIEEKDSPNAENAERKLDQNASDALLKDVKSNFSSTSWYSGIKDIKVYNNGGDVYYTVVTVSDATGKEAADRIGNAVFSLSAYSGGINGADGVYSTYILMLNESGNIVFEKSK